MDFKLSDSGCPMKIGDQEYTASMLTDRDYGDLDQYIKSVFIAMSCKGADLLDSEEKKKELKLLALREATQIGWGSEEGINIMSSLDGFAHLGFQMIRKRHPNVLLSQFLIEMRKDITKAVQEINSIDMRLNYVEKDVKGSGGTSTANSKSE